MKNYYKILGISRKSSKEEIKKAYRDLVKKYHPDRNDNVYTSQILEDIIESYKVLYDDRSRATYDSRFFTEEAPRRGNLSMTREGVCPRCYEIDTYNLAQRRAEEDIICTECGYRYEISEEERFIKSLSSISGGDCPNCNQGLKVSGIEGKVPGVKIKCPWCGEVLYIEELEKPQIRVLNINAYRPVPQKEKDDGLSISIKKSIVLKFLIMCFSILLLIIIIRVLHVYLIGW